ncbi:serine/threonine protein kinase [Hyalangium versicolor]|uniref:serine/threonine protein kinase n=1 Tax=Hyalangium versicolor TaxID=2861190 RepID=UPI001CCE7BE6|nr:protein kinase [Hyalangium versicolor]
MATAGGPSGPVILFTHEGISYEYRESLGLGPHGETLLLARKRTADDILEEVIVKCLGLLPGPPSAQALRIRARMEEEARLARYLGHRTLVRVLFLHETQDALYTVRERVQAPSLDALVTLALERNKPFSEAFLLYVGAELASALAHVHTRVDEQGQPLGIVHRNISPASIGFTWRGGVKLADFSLAYSNLAGRRKTTVHPPRGPLFFSAPETLLSGTADARSDLFALGLVLLELGTGRHLYDPAHKTPQEMAASLSRQELRHVERKAHAALKAGHDETTTQALWGAATYSDEDVTQAASGLSPSVKLLLEQLLQRDPAKRSQTAAEVEEALRTRLLAVGPYDDASAVEEVHRAVADVGEVWVADEVNPGLRAPGAAVTRLSHEITTR